MRNSFGENQVVSQRADASTAPTDAATGARPEPDFSLNFLAVKAGLPMRSDESASPPQVLAEFASSTYRSGVLKPTQSLKQVAGMEAEYVETDDNLQGLMKAANVTGNACGQILDFLVLNRLAGKVLNKLSNPGSLDTAAAALSEKSVSRAVLTSATVGFANGALLTPLAEGEDPSQRLRNGIADGTSFAMLGGVSAKLAGSLGTGMIDRIKINTVAGAAGGAVNSIMDPAMHGRAFDFQHFQENTAAWAVGNVIASEGINAVHMSAKGIVRLGEHLKAVSANPATENLALPDNFGAKNDGVPTKIAFSSEKVGSDAGDKIAEGDKTPAKIEMKSMRAIAEKGDMDALQQNLDTYHPKLQQAFPLPGEIESTEVYHDYLTDKSSTWDMEHLVDKDGAIKGGIQYQILDVGGKKVKNVGWLEHIWVDEGSRKEGFGSALLEHVQTQIKAKGGDATFWEFNNPDKMTPDEINEDAKGGITTQDRVDYWAKRGSYVLKVPSTGELAPYAQPGMDGQEPVEYLSTAWNAPGGMDGVRLSKADYEKVLLAAHKTIVDVDTDPTVAAYRAELRALPDKHFELVRFSDYLAEREQALKTDHENGVAGAEIRRNRWIGADIDAGRKIIEVAGVDDPNPEVVKAQVLQDQSAAKSPWNATAPAVQRFSPLEGAREADVVVIGGGVVGLQTAHDLGSHGIKTMVLDKGLVGGGTSKFMGAMGTYVEDSGFKGIYDVHGDEGFAKRLQALQEARQSVQGLARRYNADWRNVDSFNVSYDANDPAMKEEVDLLKRFGDNGPRFVTGDQASSIFAPAKSAIIFPGEGNLNPYKFSLGLANSGKFTVHENSPVLGLSIGDPGDGVRVYTPEGVVQARKVIFAVNGPGAPFSDLNQHLVPVQTFALTADIGRKMPGNFFDADSAAFTYWRQFGLKQFGRNQTLIGGAARMLDKETAASDAPRLTARVPQLFGEGVKPTDPFTALIFTAYSDGIPVAGPHPKYPDIWTATGAGGTGLVNGNWIARTIRQQILSPGKEENLISPDRFEHTGH